LRIKRTLEGAEIDKIIWDFEAYKALRSSAGGAQIGASASLAASRLRAECHHTNAAAVPRSAPDRVR
jgi:hypothetical protein